MKILLIGILLSGFTTGTVWANENKPFVVVELFASEGCSSCPPADDLLREITADAAQQNLPIYTLSFQVDYWNYLGWRDPYSSAKHTLRQQQYAAFIKGGVYTPEMIINGKEGFVGSDAQRARRSIQAALQQAPVNNIDISLEVTDGDIKVNYKLAEQAPDSSVLVALVQRDLVSQVTAGENEGRVLRHDNIVREFKTTDAQEMAGAVILSMPESNDLNNCSVIVFVQSQKDMSIIAASKADLQ